ncbi:MAG TPA: hypothetical protein VN877_05530 [Opitutaceae bacterium]|nr:hypothetical protein [Opitutaceae bacterium]
MRTFLFGAALGTGICLLYMGHVRQQSLAGRTDSTLSTLGQKIDGADHTPTHVKYYAAGAVLTVVGAFGLGIIKR